MKKWPLQLQRSLRDGIPASSNSTSLEQQEWSLIQETLPYAKASGFIKGDLGKPAARKKPMGGQTLVDCSRGLLKWVQSISFVAISVDHSLNLVSQADSSSPGKEAHSLYPPFLVPLYVFISHKAKIICTIHLVH